MMSRRFFPAILLAAIVLVGAFLRFYQIDGYGLWSDEFVTLQLADKASYGEVIRSCFEIPQPIPPLYFLAVKMWVDWMQPGEISLRLLSALSSTLTVVLVYLLGKKLIHAWAGLYAALLFSIQPAQIVYAQNARAYAFCLMLASGAVLAFLHCLDPASARQRRFAQAGFVLATTLLFYSHYVFAPLLLILNFFFRLNWMRRKRAVAIPQNGIPWTPWLGMQLLTGLFLLPLSGQMWKVLHTRHSLNWSSHLPEWKDFFRFVELKPLWISLAIALGAGLLGWLLLRLILLLGFHRLWRADRNPARAEAKHSGILLLLLWGFGPPLLFGALYVTTDLNLFVENYLLLASIPCYLLIPALAFWGAAMAEHISTNGRQSPVSRPPAAYNFLAHLFLVAFIGLSFYLGPWSIYRQRGHFSRGVPGGNEWRETLTRLNDRRFSSPLFFFQSPFIESNGLQYKSNPMLRGYLSAPLESFYVQEKKEEFVLLPVFWHLDKAAYRQFKTEIKELILRQPEFTLLSTRRFWQDFSGWLLAESGQDLQVVVLDQFQSSGSLLLLRARVAPTLR
jgi:hypothetical protein